MANANKKPVHIADGSSLLLDEAQLRLRFVENTFSGGVQMGFPKLPTVGDYKVSISPKTSTDDTYDGTAKTETKKDRNVETSLTPRDERDIDPRKIKKEHDAKILESAKKMDFDGQNAKEVKSIADQQAKMIRATLEKQLQEKQSK
jgi:hypothetical protein